MPDLLCPYMTSLVLMCRRLTSALSWLPERRQLRGTSGGYAMNNNMNPGKQWDHCQKNYSCMHDVISTYNPYKRKTLNWESPCLPSSWTESLSVPKTFPLSCVWDNVSHTHYQSDARFQKWGLTLQSGTPDVSSDRHIIDIATGILLCKELTRRFRPNRIWTDGHSRQRDRSPGCTYLSLSNYRRILAAISYALGDLLLPAYSRYGLCRRVAWVSSRHCWYIPHRHTHSTYPNDILL